jgi:hypothetical protein
VAALSLLREFASLPELKVIETSESSRERLIFEEPDRSNDTLPFLLVNSDGNHVGGGIVWHYRQWTDAAQQGAVESLTPELLYERQLEDLLVSRAHIALHYDILVTISPYLLGLRSKSLYRDANIMLPSEAIKMVGLYLRQNDDIPLEVSQSGGTCTHPVESYYWELTKLRLPHIWRYHRARDAAEEHPALRHKNLRRSVLNRYLRALQARDEIGFQFYLEQSHRTLGKMLYHFDYLTLLLKGAFDAQEHFDQVAFKSFKTKPTFAFLYQMVCELRNTIHRVNLSGFSALSEGRFESWVEIPEKQASSLRAYAKQIEPTEDWGIREDRRLSIEPYSFAVALVDRCLSSADEIASATDVERLLGDKGRKLVYSQPRTDALPTKYLDRIVLLS